jgi:hypothetical protein
MKFYYIAQPVLLYTPLVPVYAQIMHPPAHPYNIVPTPLFCTPYTVVPPTTIGIAANVPPSSYPTSFSAPPSPTYFPYPPSPSIAFHRTPSPSIAKNLNGSTGMKSPRMHFLLSIYVIFILSIYLLIYLFTYCFITLFYFI